MGGRGHPECTEGLLPCSLQGLVLFWGYSRTASQGSSEMNLCKPQAHADEGAQAWKGGPSPFHKIEVSVIRKNRAAVVHGDCQRMEESPKERSWTLSMLEARVVWLRWCSFLKSCTLLVNVFCLYIFNCKSITFFLQSDKKSGGFLMCTYWQVPMDKTAYSSFGGEEMEIILTHTLCSRFIVSA